MSESERPTADELAEWRRLWESATAIDESRDVAVEAFPRLLAETERLQQHLLLQGITINFLSSLHQPEHITPGTAQAMAAEGLRLQAENDRLCVAYALLSGQGIWKRLPVQTIAWHWQRAHGWNEAAWTAAEEQAAEVLRLRERGLEQAKEGESK